MHRKELIDKLKNYSPESEIEKRFRASFLTFINENTDCFERSLAKGHITGSSWILNESGDKALLTHHNKLNKWLQLGGHADGETDIVKVAKTEALEESGLKHIELLSEAIFDIDIHTIPAKNEVAEHLHYDVRFLFKADEKDALIVSSESKDLAWVPLSELHTITDQNDSIARMVNKTLRLFP
ncbi:MAG TPA: NUDIX hydrolase [Fulvivirga sp.]|nr:NUDIX hydrolase [Fulvivirga sp.]